MTNEKLIFSDPDYIWSYSRIGCYDNCKYSFYLKYIQGLNEDPRFFSQFGGFVHKILEKYFNNELNRSELINYYLCNFSKNITAPAPSPKIFKTYFDSGLEYFKKSDIDFETILDVERKLYFKIGDKKFVGIIDLVTKSEDGSIILVDHKSKTLKQRSKRSKPTQSDVELDKYYRQLYLYSIPAIENGFAPEYLSFNCFRCNYTIKEQFHYEKLEEVKIWILDKIKEIENTDKWTPNLESEFFCRNLCGFTRQCEYFQMCYGR